MSGKIAILAATIYILSAVPAGAQTGDAPPSSQTDPGVIQTPLDSNPALPATAIPDTVPLSPNTVAPAPSNQVQIQGRVEQSGQAVTGYPAMRQGTPPMMAPGYVPPVYAPPSYPQQFAPAPPFGAGGLPPFNAGAQQFNSGGIPGYGYPPLYGGVQQLSPGLQQLAPLLQQLPAQLQQMGLPQMPQMDAMPPTTPLKGNVEEKIERPSFIPGYAYSNENMSTEYHNMDILWWDKRLIPDKPQMMRLSESVIKYWRGAKQSPYWVRSVPLQTAPGNFTFSSDYSGGPKGWLQYTGKNGRWGFPLYRYWFDPS